ncbi:Glutathione synthetase [Sporothrix bragantina]|uniref:Glutathione synthetase n=1 Tax=Sporothrix bragantina TaxID=671064 RepID=A0ABP0CXE4_9PEZI
MATASSSDVSYPPAVDEAERQRLVQVIKDWSIANGLTVRPPPAAVSATEAELASTLAMTAPVTLFPSPFSRSCFEEAQGAQEPYNELYAKISQDEAFLSRVVAEVAGGDEFTTKLWGVHERVKKEGYTHKHSLGIFRSDYLIHQETTEAGGEHLQIKQVEFNTIAASFGGLSGQASSLHKFLSKNEYPLLQASSKVAAATGYSLPDNTSSRDIAAGLQAAFEVYNQSEPVYKGLPRCVVFLVQDGERNVFDQRHIEYAVEAPVFRVPFSQILKQTSVDTSSPRRPLLYHHLRESDAAPGTTFEVAVVYMRAGYGPSDYPDESAWEARYQVERSSAIKCPTVLTQVAGTKKVQQILATPSDATTSELGRFVPDTNSQATLRRTFANIYPLDTTSAAGRQAREWAQDAAVCRKFVLKPQREGGGNNYYKDKIPAHLQTVPAEHWASYILMELITPPPVANLILRNGQIEQGGVICELGIYGTCIWSNADETSTSGNIVRNETAGYLLRTKGDQSEEGGVAAGFGCMDSVNLV